MASPKRVALAGAGGWGSNIARDLGRLRGAVFAAVCDTDPHALAALDGTTPSVRRVEDFAGLIADPEIDAVVVATPPETHHGLAASAIVPARTFWSKSRSRWIPAMPKTSCGSLASTPRSDGRTFARLPSRRLLRAVVRHGDLGDVHYLHFQRVNLGVIRCEENSLWSLAPHDVAVAIDLLGECPRTVTAQGAAAYLREGVEDVAFLQMRFPSGQMAAIHVSWLDPHKERTLTMVGSRKMAVFDDMEPTEKVRIYDRGVNRPDYLPYGEALTLRFGDIVIPSIRAAEPLTIECQHFVDRLHDREQPRSDGASGLAVVRVLAAATQSLRRGGAPVTLNAF
jgi:predicted dehydrogenase